MKLDFLPLDRLTVSPLNMRFARRAPDVADLLPSVRARGILQPVIVRPVAAPSGEAGREARPNDAPASGAAFEIVAGARRFTAACLVAAERRAAGDMAEPPDGLLPCAILDGGDDADAIEASLIENVARRDPDEVAQWATFTRLVKQGRAIDEIAATFGMPDPMVRRVLALGNLLPRIRALYASEAIDRATIRHLTLASKRQQQAWLGLFDDPEKHAPTGAQARAWLLGGQAIAVGLALFDVPASGLATVGDLFGEEVYFADATAFWSAQEAAIAARREAYLADGWGEVVIVPKGEYFHLWEHEKAAKRKGGRVYIDVRASGEVGFHEGYVSRREAARAVRERSPAGEKPKRPELTATLQTYVDLHRHAAVRAALADRPGVALPLIVAHLIAGSPLWTVRREPQASRDPGTAASVANGRAEAHFAERRAAILALLGLPADRAHLVKANGDAQALVALFLRLLPLPEAVLAEVAAVAIGETLAAGSPAIEAVGLTLGVDMADWWQADAALFALLRDREVLGAIVAEVAGPNVARANAGETGATLKRIVGDHLAGADGRTKVDPWVPRWMAFPPAAYTQRGGVGSVDAHALVAAIRDPGSHPGGPSVSAQADGGRREGEPMLPHDTSCPDALTG